MAGLPGHPRLTIKRPTKTWMPGTSPGMTTSTVMETNGWQAARRRFRLYRRRRRHRRLHHRQPAVGRSEKPRADPGGRRQRQLDLVSHPGRLSLRDRQSPLGLDVPDRAGARSQRPLAGLSPRQGDRRLVCHQRHDLDARPGRRLRSLAPARPDRLGL